MRGRNFDYPILARLRTETYDREWRSNPDKNVDQDSLPGISCLAQARNTGFDPAAAVEFNRNCLVLGPGQITELPALPFDAHCIGVVRIVGLAYQRQRIASLQLAPELVAGVVLIARQWGALDEHADLLGVRGERPA